MGILVDGEFYWLLTVNTNLQQQYSPGMIGLAMRAEALAGEGAQTFKMGAGDYFYKVQSASGMEACKETVVFNSHSIKGRLYKKWFLKNHSGAVAL
jgi:CelD/BcsL family acetyltransferase involved in cellulose biosynthesis